LTLIEYFGSDIHSILLSNEPKQRRATRRSPYCKCFLKPVWSRNM